MIGFSFQFNVYKGAKLLHQLLSEDPIKIAVVGAANSELSEASGLMSELYNLVQVSPMMDIAPS